jgi:glutamine amidotransferase
MNSKQVSIVDYGVGNLYSVQRALEHNGAIVSLVKTSEEIEASSCLVLPGVGAFADGMNALRDLGVIESLHNFATSGRPILGICLGMQLLGSFSEEFGLHSGLNLIPGTVIKIPCMSTSGLKLKVPYVNWSSIKLENKHDNLNNCLTGLDNSYVYFVHSFHFIPEKETDLLATYLYGNQKITAAIKHQNITGLQFHPEKSGEVGLQILKNFLETLP